jgi:DNA-binding response OmpR family regulator
MKILLLEDELMLNESICEYLESDGHKVESFVDGLEAFEAIKTNSYDLLILDINVPGIDGLSFL